MKLQNLNLNSKNTLIIILGIFALLTTLVSVFTGVGFYYSLLSSILDLSPTPIGGFSWLLSIVVDCTVSFFIFYTVKDYQNGNIEVPLVLFILSLCVVSFLASTHRAETKKAHSKGELIDQKIAAIEQDMDKKTDSKLIGKGLKVDNSWKSRSILKNINKLNLDHAKSDSIARAERSAAIASIHALQESKHQLRSSNIDRAYYLLIGCQLASWLLTLYSSVLTCQRPSQNPSPSKTDSHMSKIDELPKKQTPLVDMPPINFSDLGSKSSSNSMFPDRGNTLNMHIDSEVDYKNENLDPTPTLEVDYDLKNKLTELERINKIKDLKRNYSTVRKRIRDNTYSSNDIPRKEYLANQILALGGSVPVDKIKEKKQKLKPIGFNN